MSLTLGHFLSLGAMLFALAVFQVNTFVDQVQAEIWVEGDGAVAAYSYASRLFQFPLGLVAVALTTAVFPLMSRFARNERGSLLRAYGISLRLLTILSLPLAMAVTFLATPLVFIVGGAQYLNIPGEFHLFGQTIPYIGGADLAFQVIIWSIPIGFVNSITQYVLIAVNQQHTLTRAFVLGVVFNVVGNMLFIPSFGYVGAAAATILSEFSLLIPFSIMVRRHVGVVSWVSVFASPLLSVAAMGAATYALIQVGANAWAAVAIGLVVYTIGLLTTGAFRGEDMAAILNALPIGPLRRLLPAVQLQQK